MSTATATIDRPPTATLPAWTIDAAAFRAIVDAVGPAARKGILGVPMVELVADPAGSLTARADDLSHGLEAWTEAQIEAPGAVTASYDVLSALLARVDGSLACTSTDKGIAVSAEGTDATVRTVGSDSLRVPNAQVPAGDGLIVPASDLARALERAEQAAAKEDRARPQLEGVNLGVKEGALFAFAADGYAAAMARVGPCNGTWPEQGYTLPAAGVRTLIRLLSKVGAGISVALAPTASGGRLVCTAGSWRWSSALIDVQFPDVAHLVAHFQQGEATVAPVGTDPFSAAMAVALVFAPTRDRQDSEKSRLVTLNLGPGGLVVSASGSDYGDLRRAVPAEADGPEVTVKVDARYVRNALAVCPETIALRLGPGDRNAIVIADPDGPDRFVMMPLVIGEGA